MNYTEQSGKILDEFLSSLSEGDYATVVQGFKNLLLSEFGSNALRDGNQAVDFTLHNAKGDEIKLSALLAKGPVILSFYRGGWCPYCNLEFKVLHDILPQIHELGASLVGISPELPDNTFDTIKKHQLQFEVMSDIGNKVARLYGIVTEVPAVMHPLYLQWGLDLPKLNGDDTWELPIPVTYVINSDGLIVSSYIEKNYTERMEPVDIIAVLKSLAAAK